MQAAVFKGPGQRLVVEDVPEPNPEPTDLVLRVGCCGICGSDLHAADAAMGLPPGCVMGHEFSGEVVEVGPDAVGDFAVGDRVTAMPCIGCGGCAACLTGDIMHCESLQGTGLGAIPGAYAEYVRVGSQETMRLPDSLDFRIGALVEPLAVGLNAVNAAHLTRGESVLVVGAGPVGLAVTLWARFFGVRSVVVSELSEARREMAAKLGATSVVDGGSDVASAFADHAGGPPDVVFECVGLPGMLMQCGTLAGSRSRVIVAGVCMESDTIFPMAGILKELSFHFVLGYHQRDWRLTLDMLEAGRVDASAMVTDVVDLAGLPSAFEALKQPTTQSKVLVEP